MSLLDIFKSTPKVIDLDAMTPEERVKFFEEQRKKEEKMMKQIKSFVNQTMGLAELLLPNEVKPIIEKGKPYIMAFLTDPEQMADTMAETIEDICTNAGIPSHHLKVSISKPKGVILPSGEKARNKDVRFELQVFNPNFQQWQIVEWDVRMQLRALKNKQEKYDITGMIKELYNAKPEIAATDQQQLTLSE